MRPPDAWILLTAGVVRNPTPAANRTRSCPELLLKIPHNQCFMSPICFIIADRHAAAVLPG